MAERIREVMTGDPVTLSVDAKVSDAARLMRERDIGSVIVLKKNGKLWGVATDRDIVVRAIAERRDPWNTRMDEVCSHDDVVTVTPETSIDDAVTRVRGKTVRRLPVVENGGKVVGVVSIGDLARERERGSALGAIAAAPPNR